MRIVLDTNVLVSAVMSRSGATDLLYSAWKNRRYELVTSNEQLEEFRRVTRYPKVRNLLEPGAAGTMHNHLRASEIVWGKLPTITRSQDPVDNFLLAMAEAGGADYLVTGDQRDVLSLKKHGSTHIVNAADMLRVMGVDPS
jgi:putative PIN family toxin of toxin-antitoxin system